MIKKKYGLKGSYYFDAEMRPSMRAQCREELLSIQKKFASELYLQKDQDRRDKYGSAT